MLCIRLALNPLLDTALGPPCSHVQILRQEGCLPELIRFIVRPRIEFVEEGSASDDAPQPNYVRRGFRSLKMLVDDPRVSGMLMDNLKDHVPVTFEIFESTTPEKWSMDNRNLPSLFHWSALVHTMLNARTAEFCEIFVERELMSVLLPWMTVAPVYETVVMLAAKALSQAMHPVLMETLTQNSAMPEQILGIEDRGCCWVRAYFPGSACGTCQQDEIIMRAI